MNTVQHWEYYLFVFIAAVGVLQFVAAYRELHGLAFFRHKILSYIFSTAAVAGSFWWFFGSADRIDTVMRRSALEGAQQFVYFNTAAFLALVFTFILSSLLCASRGRAQCRQKTYPQGLGAVKEIGYFEALKLSFKPKGRPDDTAD